jgi:hypothetical protein
MEIKDDLSIPVIKKPAAGHIPVSVSVHFTPSLPIS